LGYGQKDYILNGDDGKECDDRSILMMMRDQHLMQYIIYNGCGLKDQGDRGGDRQNSEK